MATNILHVKDYFTECITYEDGIELKSKVESMLKEHDEIALDFSGIDIILTAFLNGCIGGLIKMYSIEELTKKVVIYPEDDEYLQNLKEIVLLNAKQFFIRQKSRNE